MPKRMVNKKVIVQRDDKPFSPEIGKAFDFTAEELKDIPDPKFVSKIEATEETAAPDAKKKAGGNAADL